MVKTGFIVEGDTEKILLDSPSFRILLQHHNIELVHGIINAKGCGKLLPHNILPYTQLLLKKGAHRIFVLTDLDDEKCIPQTKKRISPLPNHIVIVSVRQIEAWFLADTNALREFLKRSDFYCEFPENFPDPFEEIKKIRQQLHGRGVDKKVLAKQMLRSGFSIENAAKHPHCYSAAYFLKSLSQIYNHQ